jgi:hypothetical protein
MLEKSRIRRAILKLAEAGPFSAADVERESAALPATVRKNLARDRRDGFLCAADADGPAAADGRTRLLQLTKEGRSVFAEEAAAAYAMLASGLHAGAPDGAPDPGLAAALETIGSLEDGDLSQPRLLGRLRLAQTEMRAALQAGDSLACALAPLLTAAIGQVARVADATGCPALQAAFLESFRTAMREEEEQRANPPLLERLAPLLPALRGWARANADGRLDHRKLLNDAVAEILTGPPPEAASLRAAIITAMQRQIDLAALKAELPRFTTEPRSAFRPDDKKSYLASEFTELHGRFDNLEHMLASRLPDRAQQQSPVALVNLLDDLKSSNALSWFKAVPAAGRQALEQAGPSASEVE